MVTGSAGEAVVCADATDLAMTNDVVAKILIQNARDGLIFFSSRSCR
jgi:hypothetical protein